jgi:hypothetical protein
MNAPCAAGVSSPAAAALNVPRIGADLSKEWRIDDTAPGQGGRICTSNRGDRAVCPAVSYPTVLHKVLHKPPPERPGTPINPLHPLIFHNNIHKAGSIRNRQVIGSSPIVGSILSIIYSHFYCNLISLCRGLHPDSADRWLHEPNPAPDLVKH